MASVNPKYQEVSTDAEAPSIPALNTPLDVENGLSRQSIEESRSSRSSRLSGDSLSELEIEDYDQNVESRPLTGRTNTFGHNEALETLADDSSKSNMKMAFMNMANSIIGAGIIGQPYAVRESGLLCGIILLIGLTIVIDWTIRLMVINAKLSGTDTFQATVSKCFGKPGLITISLAQGSFAFGGSMAFCVIIGDTIPHVLHALFPSLDNIPILSFLASRNVVIILFVTFISYPLALNKDITKLAKASGLALVSMLVIVLTVVIRGPALDSSLKGEFSTPLLTFNSGIFQGISVISFAFVCHHNSLIIYESLKKPTIDRFSTVTHWSTGVSMVACMVMGVGGFAIFKSLTKGNVLNNFPADDLMANLARFCFGFNMLTTLPLEIFVCREVILNYFYPEQPHDTKRHVIFTTVLVFSAMSVSLFTCNLGAILELVGSSSACLMAYVLPAMCFLKLSDRSLRGKLPSYASIAFGSLVMVLSTVQSLIKLAVGSESHCSM